MVRRADDAQGQQEKTRLRLVGMTCTNCAQTIEHALTGAAGVTAATVNFATETAYVEYDAQATTEQALRDVVKGTGYNVAATPQRVTVRLGGMTCAACAQTIEQALRETPGVTTAHVNLATEKATVVYDTTVTSYAAIQQAIEATGYQVLGRED